MTDLLVQAAPAQAPPTLVTVSGEIDLATVGELRRHLQALPACSTVLDLSGVSLLSASGVTELLRLHDRLARADALLVLAAAPPLARRVLSVIELDRAMVLADTVEDSLDLVVAGTPRHPSRAGSPTRPCGTPRHRFAG
jgi:anti-anti-sigma factor